MGRRGTLQLVLCSTRRLRHGETCRGDPAQQFVAGYADRVGDGPGTRDAIRRIVDSAMRDAAPPTLPDDVREAYRRLDASLGGQPGGVGAAPGDDREAFDPEETYQAALLMDVVDPMPYSGFTLGGVLAPLRVLTFWEMKRRACSSGKPAPPCCSDDCRGCAKLQIPRHGPQLRGHRRLSAVAGAPSTPDPRRGVDTLVLTQGAMSLWSFCADIPARPGRDGYFHRVVGNHLVRGTTMVTTSSHDRAVRVFYALGAGRRGQVAYGDAGLPVYGGVGIFGIRGPGIEIKDEVLGRVDENYPLRPGVVYNLNANAVIATSAGISGAHSDICRPEVARAVWHAVAGAS